jgi:hypothetical protein
LLAFKKPTEATVPTPNDTSLKDVVCAIEKLSLKSAYHTPTVGV